MWIHIRSATLGSRRPQQEFDNQDTSGECGYKLGLLNATEKMRED